MNCVKCNSATSVVDSRPQETTVIKRRRKCGACGHRFNTIEQILIETKLVKEKVRVSKPKVKFRNTFDDSFDNANYLESLSDYELEELIGR